MSNYKIIEPKSCSCGFIPVKPNKPGHEISQDKKWLVMPMGGSVVWLFICPLCRRVWANENALENVELLNAEKKNRIIAPNSRLTQVQKPALVN